MAAIDLGGAVFFDLSPRSKLRVAGVDRFRYLNGQLSNDLSKVTPSGGLAACLLNAKGRMDNYVFVSAVEDAFFIDAERDLSGKLQGRLERYIIADDVQIEDVTAKFSIFHILGAPVPELRGQCRVVAMQRFREPGHDIWLENAGREYVFERLSETLAFCDDPSAETFRIEQGLPRWGRELTDEIIPVEAGLEENAISYEKGCYIGQEVISRMKMAGQRNKKMCGLISVDDRPLEAGMKLFPIGDETKNVGWITSATPSRRVGKEIALGFMRRPFFPFGHRLDAINPANPMASGPVRVEIVDVPFPGQGSAT